MLQVYPGMGDLCFLTASTLDDVVEHLCACGVALVEGLGPRVGARGPMPSVYICDADQNLIEVAHYDRAAPASAPGVTGLAM